MERPTIWDEPARGGYPDVEFIALSGLDRMRAGERGFMPRPPIHHLFGLTPIDTTATESTFTMPASPWLASAPTVFLAGTTALVADAPWGSAILAGVPAGVVGTTSELSLSFLRPADVTSEHLTARAEVVDLGRTLGLSQATVRDAHGRLLAHGSSRYVLMKIDPLPPQPTLEQVVPETFDTPDPYQRTLVDDQLPIDWNEPPIMRFKAAIAGDCPEPPYTKLFGIQITEVSEGSITTIARAIPWLTSPARTIYGGVLAYFADNALVCAISTTLPARTTVASLDLKVNFLRPGFADGRLLRTRASVVHRGRRIAVARAEIINEDDKIIAIATGSAMIFEGRTWDPRKPIVVADESTDEE